MNTENQGINNALLVSLIISFVLHFALLQHDIKAGSAEQVISLPSAEEDIQIPIEFIPTSQTMTARQYTVGELEAVQKLVTEATETKTVAPKKTKRTGTYSLNRTKTALHHYLLDIREVIEKNKFISDPSTYSNIVGNVKISFSISSAGIFSNIQIVDSSGDHKLDKSALSAISSSSGKIKRPKNTGIKTIKASTVIKYQYGL
jgi:TonB family protein